ncbi:MAG: putative toxin-antitoxin system toxin component, PIN family [Betaproteobacteria bacterium]
MGFSARCVRKNNAFRRSLARLAELASKVEVVQSTSTVTDCRDPKDNKFLSLAIDANAIAIVTGDDDLKVLHPYKGIAIQSPADFMGLRIAPPQ